MSGSIFTDFLGCLHPLAFKSKSSVGRRYDLDEDKAYFDILDPFLLDRIKLSSSRGRRRLDKKCQVFYDPANPHIRNRGVHTSGARDIGVLLAKILGLNAYLVEAILEGHDIGHTPIGHFGEEYLSEKTGKTFCHGTMSVVIAQNIERAGMGLNLSKEVLLGMCYHPGGSPRDIIKLGLPQEVGIAKVADRVEYFFSDLNDALRFGLLEQKEVIPVISFFGRNQREQVLSCLLACARESYEMKTVSFDYSSEAMKFEEMRNWLYGEIYPKFHCYLSLHKEVLDLIYEYFSTEGFFTGVDLAVIIALMTDQEVKEMARIFIETRRPKIENLSDFGIMEIIPDIRGKDIDFSNPDLDW